MRTDDAHRARRAKSPGGKRHEAVRERVAGADAAGGRFTPWAGRRLVLAGLTVVLVAVGLIMIGMAARSLSEQRSAEAASRPPAGAPQPTAAGSSPVGTSPVATPSADAPSSSRTVGRTPRRAVGAPVSITIPEIGVQTSIMRLGLAADRTVEVPPYDKADDVGWYTKSPIPGTKGPSVLIGHIDSPDGPAVFARMAQLDAGDKVSVKRSDGTIAVFSIDRVQTFAKDKFPTRQVYGDTDHPTLRLITCGGRYDRGAGGYQANTVAFADLISIKHAQQ